MLVCICAEQEIVSVCPSDPGLYWPAYSCLFLCGGRPVMGDSPFHCIS